jgi:hypothetical protein
MFEPFSIDPPAFPVKAGQRDAPFEIERGPHPANDMSVDALQDACELSSIGRAAPPDSV